MFELSLLNVGVLICGVITTFAICHIFNLRPPKSIATFAGVLLVFLLLAHYTSWFSYVVGLVVVLVVLGGIGAMKDEDGKEVVRSAKPTVVTEKEPEATKMTPKEEMEKKRQENFKKWTDTYYSYWYETTKRWIKKGHADGDRKIEYALGYCPDLNAMANIGKNIDEQAKMKIAYTAMKDVVKELGFTEEKDIGIHIEGPVEPFTAKVIFF